MPDGKNTTKKKLPNPFQEFILPPEKHRFQGLADLSILVESWKKLDIKKYPQMNMITGGGIRNIKDIEKLKDIGIKNVIFGRAFYEGNITLNDLKNYLKK